MKNKNSMLKLAALAACLLPAFQGVIQAGAPLKINFQGRLDESGQPAAGAKTFVFKLFDAAAGGNLVWTSQSQVLTLTQGVFSAALDSGVPAGLSTATFSGARYVEITVDGVILAPRQEMVSAPYALVAQALAPDAVLPPQTIAPGAISDVHVVLTTAAITSGKFGDDRLYLSTAAFYGGFNGGDQLVQLTPAGKLPVLDGSALTGVPASTYSGSVAAAQVADGALGANVIASSVAANTVHGAALQAGAVTDAKVQLSTAAISSGRFGDERVLLSTAAISSGKFGDDQVLISTGAVVSGKFGDDKVLVSTAAVGSGKFGDDRVAISTGAFYGGFNGAGQLVTLDGSGKVSTLNFAGAVSLPSKVITIANSPYLVSASDSTILVDGTGAVADIYVVLPPAATVPGRTYTVKRIDNDSTGHYVYISGADYLSDQFETIEELPIVDVGGQWNAITVQSAGDVVLPSEVDPHGLWVTLATR